MLLLFPNVLLRVDVLIIGIVLGSSPPFGACPKLW